jgi:hypothetical protein
MRIPRTRWPALLVAVLAVALLGALAGTRGVGAQEPMPDAAAPAPDWPYPGYPPYPGHPPCPGCPIVYPCPGCPIYYSHPCSYPPGYPIPPNLPPNPGTPSTPLPTSTPLPPAPTPTPGGRATGASYIVCPQVQSLVPLQVQQDALSAPWTIYGFDLTRNPNVPHHPFYNPLRTALTLRNPNVPWGPCNPVVWKAGCP